MQKFVLVALVLGSFALSACDTALGRTAGGAIAGAAIADVTGGSATTGALIGAVGGAATCGLAGLPRCR